MKPVKLQFILNPININIYPALVPNHLILWNIVQQATLKTNYALAELKCEVQVLFWDILPKSYLQAKAIIL